MTLGCSQKAFKYFNDLSNLFFLEAEFPLPFENNHTLRTAVLYYTSLSKPILMRESSHGYNCRFCNNSLKRKYC